MKVGPERPTRQARQYSPHWYKLALVATVETDQDQDEERITITDRFHSDDGPDRRSIDQRYVDQLLERHGLSHDDIVSVDQFVVEETTNVIRYE